YLDGRYTFDAPAPMPAAPEMHHAGPGAGMPTPPPFADARPGMPPAPPRKPSLGDLLSRPPKGMPFRDMKPPMAPRQGTEKRAWLTWDGRTATIAGLNEYVLHHRRRMKPCTSFDKLDNDSGENQLFGSDRQDYMHFNPAIGTAISALREAFPAEAQQYEGAFAVEHDAALAQRIALVNPLRFIATGEQSIQARHYRIRVGARDADTSLSVAMTLAVKLANAGYPVDYALVWDQPHSEADYPGEVLTWIDSICS
ncbi:MAG: hypothetical protein ACI4WX_02950, partial [Aristaeellaceae bacterium]